MPSRLQTEHGRGLRGVEQRPADHPLQAWDRQAESSPSLAAGLMGTEAGVTQSPGGHILAVSGFLPIVTTDLATFKMGKDMQKQDWVEFREISRGMHEV